MLTLQQAFAAGVELCAGSVALIPALRGQPRPVAPFARESLPDSLLNAHFATSLCCWCIYLYAFLGNKKASTSWLLM